MIVEDDSFISQIYHQLFKLEGIEVEIAKDGLEAMDRLNNNTSLPDAIVLDVMMPRMDGFQFLEERQMSDKLKNIPVVMLTNLLSDENAAKAKSMGAVDFILKSDYDPKELVQKIKKSLTAST